MAAQVASGDGAGTLASKVGALELEKSRDDVVFEQFKSELQLEAMSKLISKDLSEPYLGGWGNYLLFMYDLH